MVDAELGGAMDGRDRFHIVGNAVIGAHARAAEPDRRNAKILSKLSILHPCFLEFAVR